MPKKKPKKYKPGKYQWVVYPDKPMERLDLIEIDLSKMMSGYKKPTLHAEGGLVKGKPKLAKKGWK